ncbi:MAG TPA: serine/threonine-protein kinase [Polyangiaceae bacterium]|nr:serine/threonine-protein kinase [Polyangiaceae bacterium]
MSGEAPFGGQFITSKLRLVRPLGRGGMSVVWLAEHRTLRSEVVVKFLNDEAARQLGAARRIAREAAAAARVRSPHVVQVLDHGVSDTGSPFIVMERLDGRDLQKCLEERGALSARESVAIVQQVAKALAKVHAAGLVHRDVKPSNVFLCEEGEQPFVKLLDFGLALRVQARDASSTVSSHCAGTPGSMSPEQIVGGAVDARTDVWSLGVLAFQCLTGKRPFEGETLGAVALAIHTLPLPRLSDARPELPAAVDTWFARACARSHEERFASAAAASEAFERALAGDELNARGPSNGSEPAAIWHAGIAPDAAPAVGRGRGLARLRGAHALGRTGTTLAIAALAIGACVAALRQTGDPRWRNAAAGGHAAIETGAARGEARVRVEASAAVPAADAAPRRAPAARAAPERSGRPSPPLDTTTSTPVASTNPNSPPVTSLYELPDERH